MTCSRWRVRHLLSVCVVCIVCVVCGFRCWPSGFCPGQPRWSSARRNIHPLTPIVVISHPLPVSASSICYDQWHPPCSIYMPDSLIPQSLSKFSLVYLLAWHPPLHIPYISSSNLNELHGTLNSRISCPINCYVNSTKWTKSSTISMCFKHTIGYKSPYSCAVLLYNISNLNHSLSLLM